MKEKNNKSIWIIGGIVLIIIVIVTIIAISRNNMTPEETVSRFMYLIENKEYEKAKKLCSEKIEYLDLLSNIKPSDLSFKYSEDKKNATSVLLEDKENAEMTTMYVELSNSLFGWKIKNYTIDTDFIPQSVIQTRLENGENISQSEFLLWALYEETKTEDISKYVEDNVIILTLFAHLMKEDQYEKAMQLYKPINSELGNAEELKEEEIKSFNWENYNIYNTTGFYGINTYMLDDGNKKINVMVSTDHTIAHIYKFI